MTAAKDGLSDGEIEDLLSLDDEVLQNVFHFSLPSDPNYIRLPQLLWRRIRHDLSQYLSQRQSGGIYVNSWNHNQLKETALRRYCKAVKQQLHISLAEYFNGKWCDKVKPLKLDRMEAHFPKCIRGVSKQPIYFRKGFINKRKIIELPYHLSLCKYYEEFIHTICCCVIWLNASIETLGIDMTIAYFNSAQCQIKEDIASVSDKVDELRAHKRKFYRGEDYDTYHEVSLEEKKVEDSIQHLENDLHLMEQYQENISQVLHILLISADAVSKNSNNLAVQVRKLLVAHTVIVLHRPLSRKVLKI